MQPVDEATHEMALHTHSTAGLGHAGGAQQRVSGYASTLQARSFGRATPKAQLHAMSGVMKESRQRVWLVPVRG